MKTEQAAKSTNDALVIAVMVSVFEIMLLFFVDSIPLFIRITGFSSLLFSIVIAFLARDRKIGVGWAYFASVMLSPVVGLILTLCSPSLADEEYRARAMRPSGGAPPVNVADQLLKLNELRVAGIITDHEFAVQKDRLLNNY